MEIATSDAYSQLKAFRHLDILQMIPERSPSRPAHVQIVLYDLCNQNCRFCAYRLEGYASNQLFDDRNMMPTGKAIEILEDCAALGVSGIQFTGGGEPTIHPDFESIVARTEALGLKYALVSNGVRIAVRHLAQNLRNASWIRVSLDAATQKTYTEMRQCPKWHFDKALEAVSQLAESKTNCVLGVGFVVNPQNWREVVDCTRLARDLGADNIRISAQFSNEDEKLFAGFHSQAAELCREAETLASDDFAVYNRFSDRLEDLRNGSPEHSLCGYQIFTTYIGADLNVYRCCGYAYNERGLIGSLKERKFRNLWMSRSRLDEQLRFDGRKCERCQFRAINAGLAYALQPQLHEEFV